MPIRLGLKTIAVLKNFKQINTSILIHAGKELRTISIRRNVVGEYQTEEEFPVKFAIYSIDKFLTALSMVNGPILEFFDSYVEISDSSGITKIKYFYGDPDLVFAPEKRMVTGTPVSVIGVKEQSLKSLLDASLKMSLPDVVFESDGKNLSASAFNRMSDTSNRVRVELGECDSEEPFAYHFLADRIQIIPGDYIISISDKTIAKFENQKEPLVYFIALESE